MLKGLVGLVLPGGAILVWALLSRRISIVPRLFSPGPLILFLALVLPWHLAIARRDGEWFDFYVVGEHFRRYFESGHRRDGSPLFFLWALLGGLLPWTPYLGRIVGAFPSIRRGEWRERGGEAYLQVFWILVLLFFSVSQSKLIPYVLPVWPAVAVLVALGLERARQLGAPLRAGEMGLGSRSSAFSPASSRPTRSGRGWRPGTASCPKRSWRRSSSPSGRSSTSSRPGATPAPRAGPSRRNGSP